MHFPKFVRTIFLKNTTGRLLLIMAVAIIVKGELANETINYGTKTKGTNLTQRCKLSKREVQVKGQVSEAVVRRCSEGLQVN